MDISIDKISERFKNHLSQSNNFRIFFSGKFGIGKSHFLNEYFSNNKDFNLFWISPINYVVGANQDIFEWIKVDIAKELLTRYLVPKEEESFSDNLIIQTYLYNNAGKIFSRLFKEVVKQVVVNKTKDITGIDIEKNLEMEMTAFNKYKNSLNRKKNDEMSEFVDKATQFKGSIFEDDLITRILRQSLQLVRVNNPDKKNILLIDDLDRLDPEHIFRILNILSAHDHFDSNKFGFDNVLIVCDKNNLESLYHYRYGPDADFDGYIEKFYSLEPFYFSLTDAAVLYCENNHFIKDLPKDSKTLLAVLLSGFFKSETLRIRNLKKISFDESYSQFLRIEPLVFGIDVNTQGAHVESTFTGSGYREFGANLNLDLLKVLFLLKIAFGGTDRLIMGLNALKGSSLFYEQASLMDIITSIAVTSHISKMDLSDMGKTFYSWLDPFVNSSGGSSGLVRQARPIFRFFGFTYEISIKWTNEKRYNAGDYFQDIQYNNIFSSLNSKFNITSYDLLVDELLSIIDFAKSKYEVFN